MWKNLRRDTDPGVSDANDGLTVSQMHPYGQLPTHVRVSRCIGEQIHEHLLQAPVRDP
jgi:hypothetical protein